ncbi:MAG TPA: N-6 DNA methylase, partial [Acidobacteriota bacterium]|nr:N-6 DNA methylase [Acidobacteriota bacterium]
MPIPSRLLERIATFRAHLDSYLSPDYKEARLREEFLNPLFEELGWDIANRNGYAEAYKDVVHEDALKISGVGTVAPDFSFRIGGNRKFFVEAKKPSVRVKDDPEPAAQLRRYSFTAGLPLGIVTDFHEFAIYDGRVRYREGDKASTARLFYCTFEELPEHWDFLAGIFSRDAVLRGGFDKYAATTKGKRGTSEFDDEFLKDMEHWRELLARNIALRNTVAQRDLNFSVQRILDRIIFLRIAEDRGIERFGQLQALTAGPRIYPRFCDLCRHADLRYNSGLFHFETEKGRDESPDRLTLDLEIDDAVLKEILSALYYPRSPYAFAVVPADVLGHVYEQFLGKVIHLTSEHRVKVEEKPEVRKAGGVYYTPTYIVAYIVAQTLGPLLDGRTPKQAEKLRVLDPACGSGSFLLGAFDYLLDWHLKYYLAHDPESWAKKKNPPIYETAPNAHGIGQGAKNWQLTTAERKRILLNNLYGVDIDTQAVEVTKLSLLLKVLEGQARELQGKQMHFERVLPDLGKNIKCGNSLIGSDFYAQENLPTLDDEARLQINAFDWPHEFKEIMAAGGFDAVIGNPPYGAAFAEQEQPYLRSRFASIANSFDSFIMFVEQAGNLLAERGRLGVIIPSGWVSTPSSKKLRLRFAELYRPESFVSLPYDVFKGAYIDTMVVVASRLKRGTAWKSLGEHSVSLVVFPIRHKVGGTADFTAFTKQGNFRDWLLSDGAEFLVLSSDAEAALVKRLREFPTRLADYADVMRGIEVYHPRSRAECKSPKRAFAG